MYFEILVLGILIIYALNYCKVISINKAVEDNKGYFIKMKESDYDFLVKA